MTKRFDRLSSGKTFEWLEWGKWETYRAEPNRCPIPHQCGCNAVRMSDGMPRQFEPEDVVQVRSVRSTI